MRYPLLAPGIAALQRAYVEVDSVYFRRSAEYLELKLGLVKIVDTGRVDYKLRGKSSKFASDSLLSIWEIKLKNNKFCLFCVGTRISNIIL